MQCNVHDVKQAEVVKIRLMQNHTNVIMYWIYKLYLYASNTLYGKYVRGAFEVYPSINTSIMVVARRRFA